MDSYNRNMGQKIKTDVPSIATDRGFIAHITIPATKAVAASNIGVYEGFILVDGSGATLEVNIESPAYPRALRIKGNQAGITGDVVITGTNINDELITETLAANGVNVVEGTKVFKTVTKLVVPARNGAGDKIDFGWNDKLGLPYKLTHNTVLASYHDNAKEGTAPTVTTSATAIELNTVDLNTALNGKQVDIYLIV